MATNDATIVKIKHEILEEVAKLVFDGRIAAADDAGTHGKISLLCLQGTRNCTAACAVGGGQKCRRGSQ